VRGNVDTLREARRLLDQLEVVWRQRGPSSTMTSPLAAASPT
jgi:hypothetical protein